MPATAYEAAGSPTITGWPAETAEREYHVIECDDETQAAGLLLAASPSGFLGLIRDDQQTDLEQIGVDTWTAKVHYRKPDPVEGDEADQINGGYEGAILVEFDTTGATQHITQCIQQSDFGPVAAPEIRTSRVIGLNGDNVEGVDILVPQMRFTVKVDWPLDAFGPAQVEQIHDMTGKVNSDNVAIGNATFFAGELLFEGGSGARGVNSAGDPAWQVQYRYAASKNRQNIAVSPAINVPQKKGWQYLWVRYKRDDADNRFVQVPDVAFVADVYEEAPMNGVFGF